MKKTPKRKINPTAKQKAAFNKLVELGGTSVSRAMREGKLSNGENAYSPETAKSPQKLTESLGFQKICDEAGLTDEFLTNALYNDIKAKKKNRKPELELAFKIKKRLSDRPEPETPDKTIHFHFHKNEKVLNIINRAEEDLAKQLQEEI